MKKLNFWSGLRPNGSLRVYFGGNFGDCIDYSNTKPGKMVRLSPDFEQKIGAHLTMYASHNYQRLTVDEGRLFTAHVSNIRLKYQFNKRTFVRTVLQFSDYDRNIEYYDDDDVEIPQ